jgi:hypothetical protein
MDTGKQLNANELIAKLQELEKENARLRKILDVHGIPYIVTEPNVTTKESLQAIFHTDSKLSLQEKVALFRSAFQGRDDVFAKRWYSSTTNKSGYQPVCDREWNREFCDNISHWSAYALKSSSTNTLFPLRRAIPCNGKATRLPSPPSGKVSWFGKNRSYDLKDR